MLNRRIFRNELLLIKENIFRISDVVTKAHDVMKCRKYHVTSSSHVPFVCCFPTTKKEDALKLSFLKFNNDNVGS